MVENEPKPIEVDPSVVSVDTSMAPNFGALRAIQQMKNIYPGTANPYKVASRRAKNKRARASRVANRKK